MSAIVVHEREAHCAICRYPCASPRVPYGAGVAHPNCAAAAAEPPRCDVCGGVLDLRRRCGCVRALDAFRRRAQAELEANAKKGGRLGPGGWIRGMTPDQRINELLYHCAKLAYAQRQYLQGDGDADKVVEFAADVQNCSMMVVDGLGLLDVPAPEPTWQDLPAPSVTQEGGERDA